MAAAVMDATSALHISFSVIRQCSDSLFAEAASTAPPRPPDTPLYLRTLTLLI
jgi:hypothetical protein